MKETRVIVCSDVHLCHKEWYGISSEERMDNLILKLNDFCAKKPCEKIVFLGDYSLDFWAWEIGGSYLANNVNNAERFIKEYASKLKINCHFHPGNHEQYGYEKWVEMTGNKRDDSFVVGGYLFVMSDNFSGILDPNFNTDGEYTLTKLDFIKSQMEKHPNLPVIICSHFFDTKKEPSEFFNFIKSEKRIVALFCGHDHLCYIEDLGEKADNVCVYHDGHFSHSGTHNPADFMWGFCEVLLSNDGASVCYVEPENTYKHCRKTVNHHYGEKHRAFFKRRNV